MFALRLVICVWFDLAWNFVAGCGVVFYCCMLCLIVLVCFYLNSLSGVGILFGYFIVWFMLISL